MKICITVFTFLSEGSEVVSFTFFSGCFPSEKKIPLYQNSIQSVIPGDKLKMHNFASRQSSASVRGAFKNRFYLCWTVFFFSNPRKSPLQQVKIVPNGPQSKFSDGENTRMDCFFGVLFRRRVVSCSAENGAKKWASSGEFSCVVPCFEALLKV